MTKGTFYSIAHEYNRRSDGQTDRRN